MEKEYFQVGSTRYTRKEKLANWFYYNKLWVLVGAVILWVVGSMLWNVLGIGRLEPDYRFVYVGSRRLPEDCIEALETELASMADDSNGDGTVTVAVTQCVTARNEDLENQIYGYGAEVTLLADITEGESHFFLMDDPESLQLSFQILAHLDGSIPSDDDYEAMDKVYAWTDCPRLASLDLGTYEDAYLDRKETGECQELLSGLYIGRRFYYDPAQEKNPEGNEKLWRILTEGAAE